MDARWPDLRGAVTFTLLHCSNAPSALPRADILKMDVEEHHSEAVAGESALATGLGFTSFDQRWRMNVSGTNNMRGDWGVGGGVTFSLN